jgi:hypothetical protein
MNIANRPAIKFAEAFLRNDPEGRWICRERERLTNAIDRIAGNEQ